MRDKSLAEPGAQVWRPVSQDIVSFLKAQPNGHSGKEQEEGADDVGGCVGEFDKEGDAAKETGVAAGRVGEDTAEDGAYDDAYVERHGQEEKGSWLILLFADDFADPVLIS